MEALTGLRFLAALHVVFYHYGRDLFPGAPAWLENIRASGYVSVSLFFILSGFVLSCTYHEPFAQGQVSAAAFWWRRFARIYPIYFVTFVLYTPILLLLRCPLDDLITAGLLYVAAVQAWSPLYSVGYYNGPGWSISDEAFFYLVFPLAARRLLPRLSGRGLLVAALLLWLGALALGGAYLLLDPDHRGARPLTTLAAFWINLLKFMPLSRLPEFLIGVALGKHFMEDLAAGRRRGGRLLCAAGLLGALGLLSISPQLPYPLLHNALLAPAFAALIYGLAHGGGALGRALASAPLVLLGNASYSLYILQKPVMLGLGYYISGRPRAPTDPPTVLLALAVLLVVSLLAYRLFEVPVQRLLLRRGAARS